MFLVLLGHSVAYAWLAWGNTSWSETFPSCHLVERQILASLHDLNLKLLPILTHT